MVQNYHRNQKSSISPQGGNQTSLQYRGARQQTQSHQCEQNQQSSSVPSPPQHLIHPDPPISSCDGANTAMDGIAHQSSSHLTPASSEAQGFIYNGQHEARSTDGGEGYSPVATGIEHFHGFEVKLKSLNMQLSHVFNDVWAFSPLYTDWQDSHLFNDVLVPCLLGARP